MVKRFRFDDEDDTGVDSSYQEEPSQIDKFEQLKGKSYHNEEKTTTNEYPFINANSAKNDYLKKDIYDDSDDEEDEVMSSKKKFMWKKWHFVLIGLLILGIAFFAYIMILSNNDGPVYGNRCEGVTEISRSKIDQTITKMKSKYSSIKDISMEIACKQLKVDITFKDGMNTKKAKSIAEETIQLLDKSVGMDKDKGKTYSHLFGYKNKVVQFEVNLILYSNNNKDFPIYGTKHVQKDKFSYTLASVKDKESQKKAKDTLKE